MSTTEAARSGATLAGNGRHEPSPGPAVRAYRVKSLAAAAALKCAVATYLGPAVGPDGWVAFTFDDAGGQVRRMIGQYWGGDLPLVQPRDLLGALIELRGELCAAKGEQAAGESEGGR